MKLVESQMLMQLAWVLRDHAEIVSGAYKFRKTQIGCGVNPDGTTAFRDLTEEEKLQYAMETMTRHCHLVLDCINHIGEHQEDSETTADTESLLGETWHNLMYGEPQKP